MNCQDVINIHQLYDQSINVYIYIYIHIYIYIKMIIHAMRSWNHSWSFMIIHDHSWSFMIIHDLMACHVRHSDSNVSSKQQAPCHRRVAPTPCWKNTDLGSLKVSSFLKFACESLIRHFHEPLLQKHPSWLVNMGAYSSYNDNPW